MLTILKTTIDHKCDNCDGRWDVNREEFPTYLGAQEAIRMAATMGLAVGFDVVDQRPDRVELERTVDDIHDEIIFELVADPIGAN